MSKVFCKDCKHNAGTVVIGGKENWFCYKYLEVSSRKRNKNNDCKDFKKKVSLWERIKEWVR